MACMLVLNYVMTMQMEVPHIPMQQFSKQPKGSFKWNLFWGLQMFSCEKKVRREKEISVSLLVDNSVRINSCVYKPSIHELKYDCIFIILYVCEEECEKREKSEKYSRFEVLLSIREILEVRKVYFSLSTCLVG